MIARAAPRAWRERGRAPLPPSFYNRATDVVARELLGAVLEHRSAEGMVRGRIVEVEAYLGPDDPACHAAAGLTARNRHLHGPPGTAYVYLVYGLHYCVNAVTREVGHGSAVLIRAIEPLSGVPLMRARRRTADDLGLTNGPGKVCQALGIDARLDGVRLNRGRLRILVGHDVPDGEVSVSARIGLTKAVDWPLRFYLGGCPWVSGKAERCAVPRRTTAR